MGFDYLDDSEGENFGEQGIPVSIGTNIDVDQDTSEMEPICFDDEVSHIIRGTQPRVALFGRIIKMLERLNL
ncbi:hypothetical protein NPIL_207981 [Nephila pilipes]|uniref:Uncharacterized protein n=1 Tax=Nephila pilipes TaxID=299642 RepID=A0A8X6N152_NEPPI|nr:hypothetical protein NPIL_207981 [Nephila pilipes]